VRAQHGAQRAGRAYAGFVLDYARPENPPVIHSLRDELREVSPGLFMGPALLRVLGKPRLVLFFACDSRPAQFS
jgi:hypothetical protein